MATALTPSWVWMPLGFWVTVAAVLGLAFGSFVGLVVHRLPRRLLGLSDDGVIHPPSHCAACGHTLRWWHNLPVIAYVGLRGRCGFCGASIGRLNLWIELAFGALWAGMVAWWGPSVTALAWAWFFSVLLVLCVIDWQTMLLPDALTLPLIGTGVLSAYVGWIDLFWLDSLLGAVLGFLMLWVTAWVFERMRGVVGMGGGDPKLMAALGAWLGALQLAGLLLVSSLLHLGLVWWQSRRDQALDDDVPEGAAPFGPAMVVAAVLIWLFGCWPNAAHADTSASAYPFKIESVQHDTATQVVAFNDGPAFVTVEVQMQSQNTLSDRPWPVVDVVPPFATKVLATLTLGPASSSYSFVTRFTRLFGDAFAPTDATPLRLPFENGQRVAIGQAFGSKLTTHQDAKLQHAVDFEVPEGISVRAVRDGVVIETAFGYQKGGNDPSLADQANLVKLQHADGSLSTYAHLSPNTPKLSVGQTVRAGQEIGWSGNTGYSSGPHLHFCLSKPVGSPRGLEDMCLPVQFATGSPAHVFAPQEGMSMQVNDNGPAEINQRAGIGTGHADARAAQAQTWAASGAMDMLVPTWPRTGFAALDEWLAAWGWWGFLSGALTLLGLVWGLGRILRAFG